MPKFELEGLHPLTHPRASPSSGARCQLKSLKSGEKWGSANQNAAVKEVGARWRSLSDAQKQKFAGSKLQTVPKATGKRKRAAEAKKAKMPR